MGRRAGRWAGAVLLLAVGIGCGGPKRSLSGAVTVGGKPLEGGTILARCADGQLAAGVVTAGRYQLDGLSAGVVRLAVIPPDSGFVEPPAPQPTADGGPDLKTKRGMADGFAARGAAKGRPAAVPVSIPAAYQDVDKTPVTHDTAAGPVKDIAIP